MRDLRWGLGSVAVLQMIVPLFLLGVLTLAGLQDTPAALVIVLAVALKLARGSRTPWAKNPRRGVDIDPGRIFV